MYSFLHIGKLVQENIHITTMHDYIIHYYINTILNKKQSYLKI